MFVQIISFQASSPACLVSVGCHARKNSFSVITPQVVSLRAPERTDGLGADRRDTRWEVGLRYRPVDAQLTLRLPVGQDMAELPEQTAWERMESEYRTMGLHPEGHVMGHLRSQLRGVPTSEQVPLLEDGATVRVAGLVIRRQRPLGKAVFITLEDELGHIPLVVWPKVYERYREVLREPFLLATGTVSRRDGTMNIVVLHAEPLAALNVAAPKAKSWG